MQHFLDYDHHEKRNIHPDITVSYVDAESDPMIITIAAPHPSRCTLAWEGVDLVTTYLEGRGKGTVIRIHFRPDDDENTRVSIRVIIDVPWWTAPLVPLLRWKISSGSRLGLQQDKDDMEVVGYPPTA